MSFLEATYHSMIGVWLSGLSDLFNSFHIFYMLFGYVLHVSLPHPSQIVLLIEPRMVKWFLSVHSTLSETQVKFLMCLFLDPHLITHHSNRGVQLQLVFDTWLHQTSYLVCHQNWLAISIIAVYTTCYVAPSVSNIFFNYHLTIARWSYGSMMNSVGPIEYYVWCTRQLWSHFCNRRVLPLH